MCTPYAHVNTIHKSLTPKFKQVYGRAKYAGNTFKTKSYQEKKALSKRQKTDDSHVRYDALEYGEIVKNYATITRIFEHELYPGGPSRIVIHGEWYVPVSTCKVSGNDVVKRDELIGNQFAFLQTCYQQPVALWPRNPLNSPLQRLKHGGKWEVLDYNQQELW